LIWKRFWIIYRKLMPKGLRAKVRVLLEGSGTVKVTHALVLEQAEMAGKPRNRTGHEPVPFPAVGVFTNKTNRLERFSRLGYYCASAQ
jgi:hypothetical protein